MEKECPICDPYDEKDRPNNPDKDYECPKCGNFTIEFYAQDDLISALKPDKMASTLLSYEIRKMQTDRNTPTITSDLLKILLKKELPNPQEQIDNLILWLGKNHYVLGEEVNLKPYKNHLSIIGTKTEKDFKMILNHLINQDLLIEYEVTHDHHNVSLSISGWAYFEQLKQKAKDSRQAFMAMKFEDRTLDDMVENHFKPAVKNTGFSLIMLDDAPKAGLIDDRMRVEIRKSRFMIADLTHQNNGAYWESGFAEGLGRPVIYTCEKSVWKEGKSHFDTNHLLTVIWDKDNPDEAVNKLKAAIRATLPDEAKLSDD